MYDWLKIAFGLKGSWKWAVKQMKLGKVIHDSAISGTMVMKLDGEDQGRIVWDTPDRYGVSSPRWTNANIFVSDFDVTTYEVV